MLSFLRLLSLLCLLCFSAEGSFATDPVSLTAEPSEVEAGGGFGRTVLKWRTESGMEAKLFAVKENGSLVQLGRQGRAGEFQSTEIFPNREYEFRLYPADNLDAPLAVVIVTGTDKVDYIPDFHTLNQKFLTPWIFPLFVIALLLLGKRFLAQRQKSLKLQKHLVTSAVILAIVGAGFIIGRWRGLSFDLQPKPDAQETIDAAHQMSEGNGYLTILYENRPQPPRYPPGFSIALLPLSIAGNYPANIIFGARIYALLYLGLIVFAAWEFGGKMAMMLTAIFVGTAPFAEHYSKIVMSETFTASLILLIVLLLRNPSTRKIMLAGAIAGILVTIRLQMIVCLPALLLAVPTVRQRVWAAFSAAPFLLANGIFNWKTFGSFFKTGYDYWLPNIKSFALEFAFRTYPQGDGPWMAPDISNGWMMIWICPCERGGPLAALPNIIVYPLILFGAFWIFAPPFVPFYGLWSVWKNWREPAAKFTLWLSGISVLLFTFYFYQAARFMATASTLLVLFAAVGLGKKLERFIQPETVHDSVTYPPKDSESDDKNLSG